MQKEVYVETFFVSFDFERSLPLYLGVFRKALRS